VSTYKLFAEIRLTKHSSTYIVIIVRVVERVGREVVKGGDERVGRGEGRSGEGKKGDFLYLYCSCPIDSYGSSSRLTHLVLT